LVLKRRAVRERADDLERRALPAAEGRAPVCRVPVVLLALARRKADRLRRDVAGEAGEGVAAAAAAAARELRRAGRRLELRLARRVADFRPELDERNVHGVNVHDGARADAVEDDDARDLVVVVEGDAHARARERHRLKDEVLADTDHVPAVVERAGLARADMDVCKALAALHEVDVEEGFRLARGREKVNRLAAVRVALDAHGPHGLKAERRGPRFKGLHRRLELFRRRCAEERDEDGIDVVLEPVREVLALALGRPDHLANRALAVIRAARAANGSLGARPSVPEEALRVRERRLVEPLFRLERADGRRPVRAEAPKGGLAAHVDGRDRPVADPFRRTRLIRAERGGRDPHPELRVGAELREDAVGVAPPLALADVAIARDRLFPLDFRAAAPLRPALQRRAVRAVDRQASRDGLREGRRLRARRALRVRLRLRLRRSLSGGGRLHGTGRGARRRRRAGHDVCQDVRLAGRAANIHEEEDGRRDEDRNPAPADGEERRGERERKARRARGGRCRGRGCAHGGKGWMVAAEEHGDQGGRAEGEPGAKGPGQRTPFANGGKISRPAQCEKVYHSM
jgi:hypothetical protein